MTKISKIENRPMIVTLINELQSVKPSHHHSSSGGGSTSSNLLLCPSIFRPHVQNTTSICWNLRVLLLVAIHTLYLGICPSLLHVLLADKLLPSLSIQRRILRLYNTDSKGMISGAITPIALATPLWELFLSLAKTTSLFSIIQSYIVICLLYTKAII